MKQKKVCLLIPAYNEEDNINWVIESVKDNTHDIDIIIINDGSTDKTLDILKSFENVTVLPLPCNLGYGGALQTGFRYALRNNYDYAIQYDADGQHNAGDIQLLIEFAVEKNADIIIGSRFLKNSGYKSSFLRRFGILFFSNIIKLLTHRTIYDPTSGFQVLSRKVLVEYVKTLYPTDYPDTNILVYMLRKGIKIYEFPVQMNPRIAGESMHTGTYKNVKYMIKMLYSILIMVLRSAQRTKENTV